MQFKVNKGVGRPIDFFGIKSQYIIYFAVGIGLALISYFVLQFFTSWLCFAVAVAIAVADYVVVITLSRKYGVNGMAEKDATKMYPDVIVARRARSVVRIMNAKGCKYN